MGFYFSRDRTQVTSTLDIHPFTYNNDKTTNDAAIIIQRWWRSLSHNSHNSDLNSSVEVSSNSDEYDADSEREINESHHYDKYVQIIINNSLLWDLFLSFYNFLSKLVS
jgi:hypothetical protein